MLQAAKKLQFSEMKPIADLIVTANQAIDHFVFCHHNREQLNRFLWRFDEFLAKLGVSSQQNQENEIDGEMTERDFKFINLDNSASAKSNLANETPSPLQQTGANGKDTEFISSDVNSKNKTMNFSLPGEEDEDLMNLIQEISSSMAITSHKKENQINFNAAISAETEEAVRDHKKYSYKTFCEEGDLFIQVILKAIEQLNENQNESAPLEDIELAGSSLKMLVKKCSFDKIAFLPELIESICINVKKTTNLLPQLIREKIKDGALFLKDFDPTNKDHESKLMTIL